MNLFSFFFLWNRQSSSSSSWVTNTMDSFLVVVVGWRVDHHPVVAVG